MSESYAETAVLIAILHGDIDEADRLLADFLPNELRTFEDQTFLLESRIRATRRGASS
jgi:hypothetical protein